MLYKKILGIAILMLLAIATAKAQIAITNVKINPEVLLVGDQAECKVTLYNPEMKGIKVLSVQLDVPYGLLVDQKFVNVGYIAKQSQYNLLFQIKAIKSGSYAMKVKVNTENGSVTQTVNVFVEKDLPKVVIRSPIKLNEVNNAEIEILSPIKIDKVVIQPMFDSIPRYLTFNTIEFSAKAKLKFYGKKQSYKFRISFYNGQNFHTYIQEIYPTFIESKGIFLNVSSVQTSYLYDVIPIKISISNLRQDAIYEVTIKATSSNGTFSNSIKIPKINPMQSKIETILYSPIKSGLDVIKLKVVYKDELDNEYQMEVFKKIEVLNKTAVSVTNLEVDTKGEFTVSGDISNNGRSEVTNVYAIATLNGASRDYFVGNIDPSDFQSFSIPIKGNGSEVIVKVIWTNELGKNFEITKTLKVKRVVLTETKPPIWILIAAALVVIIFVSLAIYTSRKHD